MQTTLTKFLFLITFVAVAPATAKCQKTFLVADTIKPANKFFAPVFIHGRWQYLHTSGNVLVDSASTSDDHGKILVFKYSSTMVEYLGPTKNDMGYTSNKKILEGVIDNKGHIIVPINYDSIAVQRKKEWSLMGISDFEFGYFIAYKNGVATVFDSLGIKIDLPRNDNIKTLAAGMLAFSRHGKWGWYNLDKNEIIQRPKYDSLAYRNEQPLAWKALPVFGNIVTYKHGKSGLMHLNGKKIARPKYQYLYYICYKTGLMRYTLDAKTKLWGLINDRGKVISKPIYSELANYAVNDEKPIGFVRNGKLGYIDPVSGKEIIPNLYDVQYGFPEPVGNRITVIKNEEMALLDWKGKMILPLDKNFLTLFDPQNTNLVLDGRDKFTTAYVKYGTSYNSFSKPFYCFIAFTENGKIGIKNWDGKTTLTAKYSSIKLFLRDGKWLFSVVQNGKQGVVNESGEIIIPFLYNKIIFPSPNYNRLREDPGYIRGTAYEQTILALLTDSNGQNPAAIYNTDGKKLIAENLGFTIRFESNNAHDWLSDAVLRLHNLDTTTVLFNTLTGKFITPALADGEKKTRMFAVAHNRFVIITKGAENYLHSKLIGENGKVLFQSDLGALQGSSKDGLLTLFKNMPENNKNLYQFVDRNGDVKSFAKYQEVAPFKYGLSIAGNNEERTIIDTAGKAVFSSNKQLQWVRTDSLKSKNLFTISSNGKLGIVDGTGKIRVQPIYDQIIMDDNTLNWLTPAKQGHWWYYIKPNGEKLPIKSKVYLASPLF